ncbi:MAG TPA: ABC transporter substrate-binding protein [Methylomirabilota bacterium]|nr:ABC transporter substrate-binding protein [Methylomirabilota bacterium]
MERPVPALSSTAFVLFAVFFVLFNSPTSGAQDLKRIKIGYPAISYNQVHIWVGKDAGLFRKYGLDADIIFFRGGQLATQALVAGDPPIVNIGTVVQAGLQGHDVVLIASSESAYNYSIVARPGIAKVEQLKGKRLGISGFGSASHNAALIVFRKFGLEPNKDVALAVTGGTTERLAAVDAGRTEATLVTPSELPRVRKQGLVEVYDMADLGIEVQGNGFATSRSFIRNQRSVVLGALKGYVEAIYYIHRNREETRKIVARYLRTSDPEVLDATYEAFVKVVSKKPYPTLKGIQFLLDEVAVKTPQAKTAKPEQFVDLSLLQQLEKEGFFNDMAKRYS